MKYVVVLILKIVASIFVCAFYCVYAPLWMMWFFKMPNKETFEYFTGGGNDEWGFDEHSIRYHASALHHIWEVEKEEYYEEL